MRMRLPLVLVLMVLPGCGIDFVAVEDVDVDPRGQVMLRSEHGEVVEASLAVRLSGHGAPPLVLLDGMGLPREEDGDFWLYRATPAVDTLQPRLDLEIQAESDLAVTLPLVTRKGPAIWRQNGDLELPVAYGGDASDPYLSWRVVLVDSDGGRIMAIDSNGTPLPRPLVLPGAFIPTGAVAGEITVSLDHLPPETMYPLAVSIRGTVSVPIPEYD